MNVYEVKSMGEILKGNSYVGRGIVLGLTPSGDKAVLAYFIMGRSQNSRNRIFREEGEDVVIYPFDESKVEDPSLIIYSPIRKYHDKLIVTNGDQTDTVYDSLKWGKSFGDGLMKRCFEPDSPNFTPRISGILNFNREDSNCENPVFDYELSILKSLNSEGSKNARYFFKYDSEKGLGHFIHTYEGDGNPLPTFQGEPRRIAIPEDIEKFGSDIWANLNEDNKISLYVRYVDLKTLKSVNRIFNVNK